MKEAKLKKLLSTLLALMIYGVAIFPTHETIADDDGGSEVSDSDDDDDDEGDSSSDGSSDDGGDSDDDDDDEGDSSSDGSSDDGDSDDDDDDEGDSGDGGSDDGDSDDDDDSDDSSLVLPENFDIHGAVVGWEIRGLSDFNFRYDEKLKDTGGRNPTYRVDSWYELSEADDRIEF